MVVENRAGANGNIAGDYVAKQPADGYTLLMCSGGTVSINPHLYAKMSFDPAKDLVPVAAAARVLVFLEVNPQKVPVDRTSKEFLAYLKANPGQAVLRLARQRQLAAPGRRDDEGADQPVRRRTSPTAAPRRRCRTCWAARSTSCSTRASACST